jgi:hypothetical protein
MNRKTVGLIGAACVALGVFCPLFNFPFFGAITYMVQRQGEGWFLLAGSIIVALFSLNNVSWPSVVLGLITLVDVGLTLSNFYQVISEADTSNPFVKVFAQSISPQIGFFLLIADGILMTICPFFQGNIPQTETGSDKPAIHTQPTTITQKAKAVQLPGDFDSVPEQEGLRRIYGV